LYYNQSALKLKHKKGKFFLNKGKEKDVHTALQMIKYECQFFVEQIDYHIHLKSSNSTSKINVELPGINPLPTPSEPIHKTKKR
jgi:hypothetical protein